MRKLLLLTTCVLLIWANKTLAQDKQRELDSIITHWQSLAKFNGTVLVAQHGKTILHKGYGILAVDNGNRLDEKTLFITGGCTEMFTATVIFKLQEEGKLNIEDNLSKYLTGLPFAEKVSIKHLLAHQSGIYDYMNNDTLYNLGVVSPRERRDILSCFKNKPLEFEPGTSFKYSTSDYYLLGMVIEKAADTNYYDAVRKYILNPLGFENSGFNFAGFGSWDKAQGYSILNHQRMIPAFPIDSTVSFAAAGLYTNSAGMYKWANAILGNKILKKTSWQTMTTERMNNYTYGWETKDIFGKKAIGHTGETYGFLSAFYVVKEDSTIILLLSNDTESEILLILDNITAALYNQPYKLPKPRSAVFLEQRRLEQYEGRYEFEGGMDLNVFSKDKLLWGKVNGQPEFTMLADVIPDEFFMTSADVEFRFIRDKKTNLVTDIIIRQNRKEQKGRKWQ